MTKTRFFSPIFRIIPTLALCCIVHPALALTGGKDGGTTSSGGTSSSGTLTTSSCIGSPTGGKYASDSYSGSSGCTTSVPGIDSDGDTMTDTWEMTYTLNQYDATDRYADPDGDGCTNACEKARGTTPKGTGTACPGFSTTTTTDADCDGVVDSEDPEPNNPAISSLTVDGTYKGKAVDSTEAAN